MLVVLLFISSTTWSRTLKHVAQCFLGSCHALAMAVHLFLFAFDLADPLAPTCCLPLPCPSIRTVSVLVKFHRSPAFVKICILLLPDPTPITKNSRGLELESCRCRAPGLLAASCRSANLAVIKSRGWSFQATKGPLIFTNLCVIATRMSSGVIGGNQQPTPQVCDVDLGVWPFSNLAWCLVLCRQLDVTIGLPADNPSAVSSCFQIFQLWQVALSSPSPGRLPTYPSTRPRWRS